MPEITLELPEVYEAITRPVAYKVLDDLIKYMNIPKDMPVVFTGSTGVEKHPGTAIGNDTRKDYMFDAQAKVMLEISEEYPEQYALQKAEHRAEENVFFSDDALDIYMKPMYQPVTVNMSFKVRVESETQANQIVQNWKKMVNHGKQDYIHNVSYHYPVPLVQLAILTELHRLRENVAGYGDNVGTYLREHFNDRMTVITDVAGKNAYFAITENQIGIIGWYDFGDTPPKFDKEGNGSGAWETTLNYKYQYDRVESVVMHYPLMVHNQMLDDRFYDKEVPYQLENYHRLANLSRSLFDKFSFNNRTVAPFSGRPGLSIPYYDDWYADYEYQSEQCLMRVMLQVDPADKRAILTLTELGAWVIDADVIAYIKAVGNGIFLPGGALFHAVLYKGQTVVDIDQLSIDSDTTIRVTDELNMRDAHHFQLSLMYDVQLLHTNALTLLTRFGEFAIRMLKMIDPSLEELGLLPTLLPDGTVTLDALKYAAYVAAQRRWLERANAEYRWWTVGQFVIKADSRG